MAAIGWIEARIVLFPVLLLAGFYFVGTATGSNTPGSKLFGYGLCLVLLAVAAVQVPFIQKHAHIGALLFASVAFLGSVMLSYFDPTEPGNIDVFTGLVLLLAMLGLGGFIFDLASRRHQRRDDEERRARTRQKARSKKLRRQHQLALKVRESQAVSRSLQALNGRLQVLEEGRRNYRMPTVLCSAPTAEGKSVPTVLFFGLVVLIWSVARRCRK